MFRVVIRWLNQIVSKYAIQQMERAAYELIISEKMTLVSTNVSPQIHLVLLIPDQV